MDLYRERDQFPSRYNFDDDLEYFGTLCEDIWFFKPKHKLPPPKPCPQHTENDLQLLIAQIEKLKQ